MAIERHQLPEPWYSAIRDAGYLAPGTDEPSLRRFATELGVHPATISRFIRGTNARGPSPKIIELIAKGLGKDKDEILSWAGVTATESMIAYEPPTGSEYLTSKQRETVNRIINAFIDQNVKTHRRGLESNLIRELARRIDVPRAEIAAALEEIESTGMQV